MASPGRASRAGDPPFKGPSSESSHRETSRLAGCLRDFSGPSRSSANCVSDPAPSLPVSQFPSFPVGIAAVHPARRPGFVGPSSPSADARPASVYRFSRPETRAPPFACRLQSASGSAVLLEAPGSGKRPRVAARSAHRGRLIARPCSGGSRTDSPLPPTRLRVRDASGGSRGRRKRDLGLLVPLVDVRLHRTPRRRADQA